jgi:ubiquinol-cytochrome c reductase cytochrome b subunit
MDSIAFYPYFFIKDAIGFVLTLCFFYIFILHSPNATMHPDNYLEANPMVTPAHIVPEWYFLSFYAILRTVPDKLGGVIAMLVAILALALVPLFATSNLGAPKYRSGLNLLTFWLAALSFFFLLKNGALPLEEELLFINKTLIGCYFYSFFFYLNATEEAEEIFGKLSHIRP